MDRLRELSRQKYLEKHTQDEIRRAKEDIQDRKFLEKQGVLTYREKKDIEMKEKIVEVASSIKSKEDEFVLAQINSTIGNEDITDLKQSNKIYALQEKYNPMLKKQTDWEEEKLKAASSAGSGHPITFSKFIPKDSIPKQTVRIDYTGVQESLPVFKYKKTILETLDTHQVLVVVGETGSGKSTQIPQYLLERGPNENVICTQPRRVAAMSVASRVASERHSELGFEVGYTVRFDDKTTERTRIRYMTDGMLLRVFLQDPLLSNFTTVMIDEAHERSISTDILLSLIKDLAIARPDLRVIIASATIDAETMSKFFGNAPILYVPGRRFSVDLHFAERPVPDYEQAVVDTVVKIHNETSLQQPCDILVFMTGQEEIDKAVDRMNSLTRSLPKPIEALPLYAALPSDKQAKIFMPASRGARKVIFATNIAETSITIDTVKYVVDTGRVKQASYNPKTKCGSLDIVPISRSSADQRAGRAGRVANGVCYRLYTEAEYANEFEKMTPPELVRCDFTPTMLLLLSIGITNIVDFNFLSSPPADLVKAAYEQLYALRAIDFEGNLTERGMQMAKLPVSPMAACAIISSWELGCAPAVITICAILESGGPLFYLGHGDDVKSANLSIKSFYDRDWGDHITALNVFRLWEESEHSADWCIGNHVQLRTLNAALNIQQQLFDVCSIENFHSDIEDESSEAISRAFTHGFFLNSASLMNDGSYHTLWGSVEVAVHPSSSFSDANHPPRYVCFYELALTTKCYMRTVISVKPEWLNESAPKLFEITGGEVPIVTIRK